LFLSFGSSEFIKLQNEHVHGGGAFSSFFFFLLNNIVPPYRISPLSPYRDNEHVKALKIVSFNRAGKFPFKPSWSVSERL
jgi:hypothetical protein